MIVASLRRLAVLTVVVMTVCAGAALATTVRWIAAPVGGDDPLTLLVIGSDQGPPRSGSPLAGRADGLHLVVISPDRRHVSILDFPRDLYVPVAGRGTTKINACLVGGPEACVATVQDLTGMSIEAYFLTGFRGLAAGIDLIGGLELEVEQPLHDPFSGTDLEPGRQRLDGGQVLAYTRDRMSRPGGDIDRSAAHARVLMALHERIADERPSATRIAEYVANLRRTTVSDAGVDLTLRLAYLAARIPPDRVDSQVVDGRLGSAGGASVLFLTEAGRATLADVADDGRLDADDSPG